MRALQRMVGHLSRWLQERHFMPGMVIHGRYEVEGRLGMGSYGVTYMCRDLSANGKNVVLKTIQPLRGGDHRAQLIYDRELRAMQALDHPQMPRLLDHFVYRKQRCLVMSFMNGYNMGELLFEQEHSFTERESLQFMLELSQLVQQMHERQMVHRDISLSNVLWDKGRIQLIDFGLTWHQDEPPALVQQLDELVSGDEQEKVIRRSLHVRSDFYGMGHLLLYMLYSSFDEQRLVTVAQGEDNTHRHGTGRPESEPLLDNASWEQQLDIHPYTHQLIRRLLQADTPYDRLEDVQADLRQALSLLNADT
ncbi:serine/threonine protein kinase [Paenibacillus sp. WLX1005]|uniref:serine/threonine protein kinase n=1 Tax=Paenibacillus sp. WLX1005 TaxID=3243766 RepID=UPI0039841B5F